MPAPPPVCIIAEIGVNHGGDPELAKRMIDTARAAGADAVKFQTFTARALVTPGTPKVRYQERTTDPAESHYRMIESLELSRAAHRELFDHCRERDIEFLSTPYDPDSAAFLTELGVARFKTASADIVDLPLHEYIAATGRPCLVSTGMATLGEVDEAVQVYRRHGAEPLLLHCVANYPCADASLNLRAMQTLARAFGCPVGYSDHSPDHQAAVLAVALGARVIEKHFTLDRGLPGPDHAASATPEEFRDLVTAVRRAELMLGSPVKACQEEERQMRRVARKSLVTARPITAGERLGPADLTAKRPGTGLPPGRRGELIGKVARRDLPADHPVSPCDFADA